MITMNESLRVYIWYHHEVFLFGWDTKEVLHYKYVLKVVFLEISVHKFISKIRFFAFYDFG